MGAIHISGAEAVRDFPAPPARVRPGHAVVIDDGLAPPDLLRVAEQVKGRTLSAPFRLAEEHAGERGFEPVLNADCAADVAERIRGRKMRDTSAWD
jgi:hypothetical protein